MVSVPAPTPAMDVRKAPKEIVFPPVNRSMSAPLRPSSRIIPAAVEARFAHRDVYTLVIPGPSLPGYWGDWVMWFAENGAPDFESRHLISAPLPARKYSVADEITNTGGPSASVDLQFGAIIDKTGRLGSVTVIRGTADPALRRRALEELGSWEFKPALRNGQPMDVDVVLDIPFRFKPEGGPPH
jgi:TonB family protein